MRFHSLNLLSVYPPVASLWLAVVCAAGCGPDRPPGLEGFGDIGETEGDPTGDGDPSGDGDGDPTGDGDGDCIDIELGNEPEVYFGTFLELEFGNDHDGECGPTPGPDLSAAWTAPFTATYQVSTWSEVPMYLSVLRGGCGGALEGCDAFNIPNTVNFSAIAGQRYTFVVDTEFDFGPNYVDFSLVPLDDTPSDCPVGELVGTQAGVFGSTFDTSDDFGSQCGGEGAPDHGYLFVPPVTGVYEIDTFNSDYDTVLHVVQGECGGPVVTCNDDAFNGMTVESQVTVELFAGQPYTIVVDGFGDSAGNYDLNVKLIDGQAELCDDAQVLASMVPAFVEWPAEFDAGNLYFGCSFASFERRFVWTAPATGVYRASQDGSPNFSGLAVLLDGCAGQNGLCATSIPGDEPTLVFEAEAGQEIVFVSEWEPEAPALMSLIIEAEGGGSGCGESLGSQLPAMASGTTLGAGNDYEGSCSFDGAPEAELSWTAPATGSYLISLEGSNYDTLMYIRDGGCDGPELGCNDDTITDQMVDLWSSISLDLTEGQTISIFIDGYNGSGTYELSITPT